MLNVLHNVERQCDSISKQKDTMLVLCYGIIANNQEKGRMDSIIGLEKDKTILRQAKTIKVDKLQQWGLGLVILLLIIF